jgi:hypothetical protein
VGKEPFAGKRFGVFRDSKNRLTLADLSIFATAFSNLVFTEISAPKWLSPSEKAILDGLKMSAY